MRTSTAITSLLLLALGGASSGAQQIDSVMAGMWEGRAEITVPWTTQRTLSLRITVERDGRVTGTIGDATLVDGRLCDPRGAVSKVLRVGHAWAVEGDLSGAIVRADGVTRERVHVLLDWNGREFRGELQTNGNLDGAPAEQPLTAAKLVLRRVPAGP